MRIIFMGTPAIAIPTLEQLIKSNHEIVTVFTQPDRPSGRGNKLTSPPIKEFAQQYGLPVFQPTKVKTSEMHEHFSSFNADIAIVVAYGRILPQNLLDLPKFGCLNVHFSLLPKYRGAAPVNWAIANGEALTGITIMQMDSGLDTGDILYQVECWISREDTTITLSERLSIIGAQTLLETLKKLSDGEITATPQDHSKATYAPILKREDGIIDWSLSAESIAYKIRGFQPWPGCYTTLDHTRVIIWKAKTINEFEQEIESVPGTFVDKNSEGLIVACGQKTFLQAEELQMEGRKRLPAKDFINGLRLNIGTVFCNDIKNKT